MAESQQPNLLEQARQQYPMLRDVDIGYTETPKENSGYLEFWPKGETGGQNARPNTLPIDKPGLEVYDKATRPIDILGDIVSHQLVHTDDKLKNYYAQFEKSLTPEQHGFLQEQYQHAQEKQGESRPFADWAKSSGLPAFFRGYVFEQWPKEDANKYYTPEQLKMFDEMSGYLKSNAVPLMQKVYDKFQQNKQLQQLNSDDN